MKLLLILIVVSSLGCAFGIGKMDADTQTGLFFAIGDSEAGEVAGGIVSPPGVEVLTKISCNLTAAAMAALHRPAPGCITSETEVWN